MRRIERTKSFKRDYKREAKRGRSARLDKMLVIVVATLADDNPLNPQYRDHALTGEWKDHRDCHIRPDLILIYRKHGDERLQLVRLGSHSELGL